MILIIILDGVDGFIARKRGEISVFSSVFDIAVDRVVENVLWIVLADLDMVPVWVAIVFIARSLLVDSLRGQGIGRGETPFGMLQSPLGRFLVAGRFMRGFYGAIKAITFAWLLLLQPMPTLALQGWSEASSWLGVVSAVLSHLSVITCLVRAVPVLIEFALSEPTTRAQSKQ